MTKLTILSADDKIAEIRRLYFATTKLTIAADLARAVQLLTSMHTDEERERAAVYMDGLAQMRSDWAKRGSGAPKATSGGPRKTRGPGKPGEADGPSRERERSGKGREREPGAPRRSRR